MCAGADPDMRSGVLKSFVFVSTLTALLLLVIISDREFYLKLSNVHTLQYDDSQEAASVPLQRHIANGWWKNDLQSNSEVSVQLNSTTELTLLRSSSLHKDFPQCCISQTMENELVSLQQNVKKCLRAINLTKIEEREYDSAKVLLLEYRKVIPQQFLRDCSSHCWETEYKINIVPSTTPQKSMKIVGNIGNVTFSQIYSRDFEIRRLDDVFDHQFSSHLVCLPKVFLAGFMKCGSTFLDCFLTKLIQVSLSTAAPVHGSKEPRFWVEPASFTHVAVPNASDLGGYIANFVKGILKIETERLVYNASKFVLVDGSPFYLNGWPRYHMDDDNMTNTCLLPSTMSLLLPKAKYIVIMREPVSALYSSFWFSCVMYNPGLSRKNQLKGPDVFHERVMKKVDMFNECMTDKSVPALSHPCSLKADSDYGECIVQRFHLLHRCLQAVSFDAYSSDMPRCGDIRFDVSLYYVHIQKWLSVIPREQFLFLTLEEMSREVENVTVKILKFLELPLFREITKKAKNFAQHCTQNSQTQFDYKNDHQLQIKSKTLKLLQKFFHPFKTKLAELIEDTRFLWR